MLWWRKRQPFDRTGVREVCAKQATSARAGRSRRFGSELFAMKMTFSITPDYTTVIPDVSPQTSEAVLWGSFPLSPASWLSPPHCPVCLLFPAAHGDRNRDSALPHACALSIPFCSPNSYLLRARFQIEHAQGTGKMRVGYHSVAKYILSNDCPARKCSRFKLRTPVNWHISN